MTPFEWLILGALGTLVVLSGLILYRLWGVGQLGSRAREALNDFRTLRRNLHLAAEQSLTEFRRGLEMQLEETRRLNSSVQEASSRVDRAAARMEDQLVDSVERHVGGTVQDRIEPLLGELDRLLHRLEARGASPFKTAQARILSHLLGRGDVRGKHTAWERAVDCLPVHERDIGNEALEDLVRKGLVVEKPTGYGRQVSLNQDRLEDVRRVMNGETVEGA